MSRLFVCLFIALCHVSYARQNAAPPLSTSTMPQKVRIYVTPENVMLHEKEIYVLLQQGWVKTPVLLTDSKGFYVEGRVTYSWDKEDQRPSFSAQGSAGDDKGNYAEIELQHQEGGEGSLNIQAGRESQPE